MPSPDLVRKEKLIAKLLVRCAANYEKNGLRASDDTLELARKLISARIEMTHGLNERDIRDIVGAMRRANHEAPSVTNSVVASRASSRVPTPDLPPLRESQMAQHDSEHQKGTTSTMFRVGTPSAASTAGVSLLGTTKRTRQMLADEVWSKNAWKDRCDAVEGKKAEHLSHLKRMHDQQSALDSQISEHKREQELERQRREQLCQEVTRDIEQYRQDTLQEKQAAHAKAMKEKRFREAQANEMERQREKARQEELAEHERQKAALRAEEAEQHRQDMLRRQNQQEEWKKVMEENVNKLRQKAEDKEKEAERDRIFQKAYADRLDRIDRERAEAKQRKEMRQKHFQHLAENVSGQVQAKQQNLDNKIEAEFNEQLRKQAEEEERRKQNIKLRMAEMKRVLQQQCESKEEEKRREREESYRLAANMRLSAEQAAQLEDQRKVAAKAEAARLKEFLNTQLQIQYYKDTRPIETSIARPQSKGSIIQLSPSRTQGGPTPTDV